MSTDRATDWSEVPLTLSTRELMRYFNFSKQLSYTIANLIGVRVGKRLVIPKARLQQWLESSEGSTTLDNYGIARQGAVPERWLARSEAVTQNRNRTLHAGL